MSLYESLLTEIEKGMDGKNGSIPFPLAKLDTYLDIAKNTNYLIVGDTGCLTGDTKIMVSRKKHKSRVYSLEILYKKHNNIPVVASKGWDLSDRTFCLSYNYETGLTFFNEIEKVVESGIKEVYKLTLESGDEIKATKDHKFLTSREGEFKSLENLSIGDVLFAKSKNSPKGRRKRTYRYEVITKMRYYPSARDKKVYHKGRRYIHQRIRASRLAYDANLNNVSVEEFLTNVKNNPNHGYIFSDLAMEIHHKDEDTTNDNPDNLELISKQDHAKLHGLNGRSAHFGNRGITESKICNIEHIGEMMTYDIQMKDPYNNFIANDIVVHNSGKSTVAQDLIINILEWYYLNQDDNLKLSIIYLGMERKQYNYSAKWVSRMIFKEEGEFIPIKKILGRQRKRDQYGNLTAEYDLLTPQELEKVKFYARKFDLWEQDDTFICIEGTHNPTGIKIFIDNFAKKHGEIKAKTEGDVLGKQTYIPHHPNHIVLIVTDYVGVLDKERDDNGVKKNRLDIYSSVMRKARDVYGFSPINIQQLSREVSSVSRLKLNDVKPKLSDIADTSELARDADVVLAVFEPWRYLPDDMETDLIGYNLHKLKDKKGYKYYRSLHILKSSFDGDGITMGCAFHPQTGIIKPMPTNPANMKDDDYESITNWSYFLTD